jgi:hypothetical protein
MTHAPIEAQVEYAVDLSESLAREEGVIVPQALTGRLVEELPAQTEQDGAWKVVEWPTGPG